MVDLGPGSTFHWQVNEWNDVRRALAVAGAGEPPGNGRAHMPAAMESSPKKDLQCQLKGFLKALKALKALTARGSMSFSSPAIASGHVGLGAWLYQASQIAARLQPTSTVPLRHGPARSQAVGRCDHSLKRPSPASARPSEQAICKKSLRQLFAVHSFSSDPLRNRQAALVHMSSMLQ